MERGKNEHFNQCFHEITYKIKKIIKKIYYPLTLIFLEMLLLVETQN